jgi:DNA polymerase III epsilon subunit-like protein
MWWDQVVAFDTETSGFGPDARILEFAVVHFHEGSPVRSWATLLNPGDLDWDNEKVRGALAVNKLTREELQDQPRFEEVMARIREELAEQTLVAHNMSFDVRMLEQEFARALNSSCCPLWSLLPHEPELRLYTCALDRVMSSGQKGFKLSDSAARWGVELNGAHRAIGDAECCGRILQKMIEKKALSPNPDSVKQFTRNAVEKQEQQMARFRR